ncbi:thioredoxin family protein [Hyphomicrobium sp. B1]|uniref:thioredoxin family protein n=1 Tax=Hyphomicrobium sp. B1 TaxID=3075651 RepID=UPI003C2FAADE
MSLRYIAQAALALAMMTLTAAGATAAERKTFDEKDFAAAQAQGKPILIDISATWCPTCQAQKPIIQKLSAEPQYENLTIFDVDFDTRKDVLRKFGAQVQSTLIVFKGDKETGRSVGATSESAIDGLMRKAL